MCVCIYIHIQNEKAFLKYFGILPTSVYLSKNHIYNLIYAILQFNIKRLQK